MPTDRSRGRSSGDRTPPDRRAGWSRAPVAACVTGHRHLAPDTPATARSRSESAVVAFEAVGGSLSFVWSALSGATPIVRVGTLADIIAANPGVPVAEGFPAYVAAARAFIVVVEPTIGAFLPGQDATGDGTSVNVRALSQVCPHLGCRPNPCVADFWFHCPCHQSRYDRFGIKPEGTRFGPAPRGMDRFAVSVDGSRRPDDRHDPPDARAAAHRPRAARRDPATRGGRLRLTGQRAPESGRRRGPGPGILRLYPRWWRRRFGDEMEALLDDRGGGRTVTLDLVRGALDAWLHPPRRSATAPLTALSGGAMLCVVALGVVSQPVLPDWPYYLEETLIPAALAATVLTVASVGAWLRGGDGGGRAAAVAIDLAVLGHLAWAVTLLLAASGSMYGPPTAIAQAVAAIGTVAVGLRLIASGDTAVGPLLVVAGVGLVLPTAWGWLLSGSAWTLVGLLEWRDRQRHGDGMAVA